MESYVPTVNGADVLQPAQEHIQTLEAGLTEARAEAADAIANLAAYKSAVRATVIENIKNGTICLAGANEALEDWGDERYQPRFQVRVIAEFDVVVDAEDSDDARDVAYQSFRVVDENDETIYLNQSSTDGVERLGE